jgi:hypothetical protein
VIGLGATAVTVARLLALMFVDGAPVVRAGPCRGSAWLARIVALLVVEGAFRVEPPDLADHGTEYVAAAG